MLYYFFHLITKVISEILWELAEHYSIVLVVHPLPEQFQWVCCTNSRNCFGLT